MKNIITSLLMTSLVAPEDAPTGGAPAPAPAAPASTKQKQHTITVTESDKAFLKDLQGEFYGPQASNPDGKRYLSTEEAFHVLLEVATSNRFTTVEATDENGDVVYDEDGNLVMERIDRFEMEARKLISAREFGRTSPTAKVSALEAQIAALKAELAARDAEKVEEITE